MSPQLLSNQSSSVLSVLFEYMQIKYFSHSRKATELSWQAPARPRVCLIFWGFFWPKLVKVMPKLSNRTQFQMVSIWPSFFSINFFTYHLCIFICVFPISTNILVCSGEKKTFAHSVPKHKKGGGYTHALLSKILQTQLVYLLWLIKPDTRDRVVLYFLSSFNKQS